jgi:hypothetical protein
MKEVVGVLEVNDWIIFIKYKRKYYYFYFAKFFELKKAMMTHTKCTRRRK